MNIENAQFVSVLFMTLLLIWSVSWISIAVFKLKSDDPRSYWWKTHMLWCAVNVVIVIISLIMLFSRNVFDADYVVSQRNIVLINVFLNFGYGAIAALFIRKASSKYVQIGRAIMVQAIFLFILDVTIVSTLSSLL